MGEDGCYRASCAGATDDEASLLRVCGDGVATVVKCYPFEGVPGVVVGGWEGVLGSEAVGCNDADGVEVCLQLAGEGDFHDRGADAVAAAVEKAGLIGAEYWGLGSLNVKCG